MSGKARLTVNGKTIGATCGQTLIEAAAHAGHDVPHLCWHPDFHAHGSCRICTVKVDGRMAVLGQRVDPAQQLEIDPRARAEQARQVTILLHKPIGYVSGQAEDGYEPAVVLVQPANHWSGDSDTTAFHPG